MQVGVANAESEVEDNKLSSRMFIVSFWKDGTRWITCRNKERDSLSLSISISSLVRSTNGAFLGCLVQCNPHKTFPLHGPQIPSQQNLRFHNSVYYHLFVILSGCSSSSRYVVQFSVWITLLFAETYLISITIVRETFPESDAILICPACKFAHVIPSTTNCWAVKLTGLHYAIVWSLVCGMRRGGEVYFTYTEFYFSIKEIGSFGQFYQIIESDTAKEEKSYSYFWNCLPLSQWLIPGPRAVNPIFPV